MKFFSNFFTLVLVGIGLTQRSQSLFLELVRG